MHDPSPSPLPAEDLPGAGDASDYEDPDNTADPTPGDGPVGPHGYPVPGGKAGYPGGPGPAEPQSRSTR